MICVAGKCKSRQINHVHLRLLYEVGRRDPLLLLTTQEKKKKKKGRRRGGRGKKERRRRKKKKVQFHIAQQCEIT